MRNAFTFVISCILNGNMLRMSYKHNKNINGKYGKRLYFKEIDGKMNDFSCKDDQLLYDGLEWYYIKTRFGGWIMVGLI